MWQALQTAPAIIFDMRGYPKTNSVFNIPSRLTEKKNVVMAQDAQTYWEATELGVKWWVRPSISFGQKIFEGKGEHYKAKVVVLIDENAQSASEHFCLGMEVASDVTFIGTPTAGANGSITTIALPGNLDVIYTGLEIKHADGRQLQRVGIQPHIRVEKTIKGITEGRDEQLAAAIEYLNKFYKRNVN